MNALNTLNITIYFDGRNFKPTTQVLIVEFLRLTEAPVVCTSVAAFIMCHVRASLRRKLFLKCKISFIGEYGI